MDSPFKRIAIVTGGLKRAGAEKVACDLAQGMKIRGFDVSVFSIRGGDFEKELQNAGIDIQVFIKKKGNILLRKLQSLIAVFKMAHLLKEKKVQVINIHGLGAERISLLAARLAGTPVRTFVFHSNYPVLNLASRNEKLRKRLIKDLARASHCIAISSTVKNLLLF